jgi:hypothetical protein
MTAPVDVLVDRDDDVATTKAIHRLATDHSTVLAATIAPDWRSDRAVTWAILRALGKRTDLVGDLAPDWMHAERWLVAHQVRELIILRAQHLTAAQTEHLVRMGDRADIALVFIHSPCSAAPPATLTPSELLARPRRSSGPPPDTPTWPVIPHSHPWRLRNDCARQLSRDEFRHVDELLFATHRALEEWLRAHRRPTQRRLGDAIRVLRTAHDPNQRHVRQCAIIVALQSAGYKPPRWTQSTRRARELTDHDVDEVLGYTSANHGAFLLAKRLTGLSRDLLDLVLGDQVTDDEILGYTVPPRAQPILRALPSWSTPVISPPRAHAAKPPPRRPSTSAAAPRPRRADPNLAVLFSGRSRWVAIDDIPEADRHEYTRLHEHRVLDLDLDLDRGQPPRALQQLPAPSTTDQSTDKRVGRFADINRESR